MKPSAAKNGFKAGTLVTVAGIYEVVHVGHREPHFVTFRENEKFPRCAHCGDEVRYFLRRPAVSDPSAPIQ